MAVTLHTSLGDIKVELFCDLCPRACENFLGLTASKQYDGTKVRAASCFSPPLARDEAPGAPL